VFLILLNVAGNSSNLSAKSLQPKESHLHAKKKDHLTFLHGNNRLMT
jgi:hypothetical protein